MGIKVKGHAFKAHGGGSGSYLHVFVTWALDGVSCQLYVISALTPRKILVPIEFEAGLAGRDLEKGIEPRFLNQRTRSLVTIPTELHRCRTVGVVGLTLWRRNYFF